MLAVIWEAHCSKITSSAWFPSIRQLDAAELLQTRKVLNPDDCTSSTIVICSHEDDWAQQLNTYISPILVWGPKFSLQQPIKFMLTCLFFGVPQLWPPPLAPPSACALRQWAVAGAQYHPPRHGWWPGRLWMPVDDAGTATALKVKKATRNSKKPTKSMKHLWQIYDISMKYLWTIYEISMKYRQMKKSLTFSDCLAQWTQNFTKIFNTHGFICNLGEKKHLQELHQWIIILHQFLYDTCAVCVVNMYLKSPFSMAKTHIDVDNIGQPVVFWRKITWK